MKIRLTQQKRGFTLIEMIGVLAVIAILAALLIPKIFEAINNARINNACVTISTAKTAIADHYAKFGSLASANGTVLSTFPVDKYDQILLQEGFLDKPFSVKIGDGNATNRVLLVQAVAADKLPSAEPAAFDLDGDTTIVNDATGGVVAIAAIGGVTRLDAWELSKRLDGDNLSASDVASADTKGRVKYDATAGATTVFIYLTHR